MTRLEDLIKRADELIELAKHALANMRSSGHGSLLVHSENFANLRSSSLSFIEMLYGREHSYYREFDKEVNDVTDYKVQRGLGMLTAIRNELVGGWLQTTRGLISAEVFADFLEMAEHLLSEGYKDAAAVIGGGVLEEHLRQLSRKAGLPVEDLKDGKLVARKAELLNAELTKTNKPPA